MTAETDKAVAKIAPAGLLHSPPTVREQQLAVLNEYLDGHHADAAALADKLETDDVNELADALIELSDVVGTIAFERGGDG